MLVSVILPVFNGEDTILDAVDSVLSQTHTDLELIIVNDGSTDCTSSILDTLIDPRVQVISTCNQGVSNARNTALLQSTGDFISFIDSDDIWLPHKIEKQLAFCDLTKSTICFTGFRKFFQSPSHSLPCHNFDPFLLLFSFKKSILANNPIALSTTLISRSVFQYVGLFDVSIQGPEDWDYWIRARDIATYVYIPSVLALYRKSPDSITSNFDSFEHQEWLVLKKHCIDNSSVSALLKYISVLVYHIKCTCRRMSSSYTGSTKLVSLFYVLSCKRSRNILPLVLISIIGRAAISAMQDFQYQLLRIKSGTNKM